jgi:apolipoprotein N-acyltransferase
MKNKNNMKTKSKLFEILDMFGRLFLSFFIIVTGTTIAPLIVKAVGGNNWFTLLYLISVIISAIWLVVINE